MMIDQHIGLFLYEKRRINISQNVDIFNIGFQFFFQKYNPSLFMYNYIKLFQMLDQFQSILAQKSCSLRSQNALIALLFSQDYVHIFCSARFTHSAAEMQLLGFIRSTKRKTDHVTRLTWGNV